MQETRNSCGLYGTFVPYSSLATKHDNTMTWPFLPSSDNTIKENSLSSTFRLHLQSSNNQDVKNFSVSTFDVNMIYIKWIALFNDSVFNNGFYYKVIYQ